MSFQIEDLEELEGRQYRVVLPQGYENSSEAYPVVYINGDRQVLKLLKDQAYIAELKCILIIISSQKRLDDFSPWFMAAESEKGHDFGGKGAEYLEWILNTLKPAVDKEYRTLTGASDTAVMGQSVGGLISLYAMCQTDQFGYAACISPSSWFPGFIKYFEEHVIIKEDTQFYISTGTKEGAFHGDSRKHAVKSTEKIYNFLRSNIGMNRVTLYQDDGKHQDYLEQRFQYALLWLNSRFESAKG
ncbi:MAG: alpha/beta hydrolase [Lachnospiraceae bacterium]